MSEPFLGEIKMVGFNFAPRGYAGCDGQLLPIAQNTALFSLLGTIYGGDGRQTFALPDLRGRVPMKFGQGPGLSNRTIGERGGEENRTLTVAQLPAHTHAPRCLGAAGNQSTAANHTWSDDLGVSSATYSDQAPNANMNPAAIGTTGGGQAFSIVQPYLVINFVIALQGIFPSRN